MDLNFYYDVVCPHAYLASLEVEALAERTGATVVWKPVLLGGLLRAVGSPDNPVADRAQARILMDAQDLLRQAALRQVPLGVHPRHPVRSLDAMRLVVSAPPHLVPPLSQALFEAYHVHGRDISDRTVLAELAGRFGLDVDPIHHPAVKQALHDRTDEALAIGAFGVPTFHARVGPDPAGRIWWGADRMHLVEAALVGIGERRQAPPALARDGAIPLPPAHGSGPARVELFHDFSSPFSYLGSTQARRIAESRGAELVLRPMLLGALFRDIGTPDVPIQAMNSVKARYMLTDLQDWARWWGVPFAFPDCFPVRTVTALRVAIVEPLVTPHLYAALWQHNHDIGDPTVLREVLDAGGFEGARLIEQTQDPAVKAALRDNTDTAVAIGACGAPTWRILGDDPTGRPLPEVVVWGQDRLDQVGACVDGWRPWMG